MKWICSEIKLGPKAIGNHECLAKRFKGHVRETATI